MIKAQAKFTSALLLLCSLIAQNAYASDLSVLITAHKDRSTKGVVVELAAKQASAPETRTIEIDQKNQEFIPLISVATVGSKLIFNNLDELKHHVYSASTGNQFDLPLHNGIAPDKVILNTPGVVKLGCNIHDWMLAYVYVSESNWVKIMDSSGEVNFENVPAGDYELRIWSPRLRNTKKALVENITIKDDQSAKHEITIKLRKRIRKPKRMDKSVYYDS